MTIASSARTFPLGGETERRAVKAFPQASGPVFFEDDRQLSGWEPFEPDHESLTEFAQIDPAEESAPLDGNLTPQAGSETGAEHPQVKFDVADLILPARSRAVEELVSIHAQSIEAMEARHRQELDELGSQLTQDLSLGFADALRALETTIASELKTRLASLLAPLLTEHAKRASVAAIVEELYNLILSGKLSPVKLSGPSAMISGIKQAMGDAADRISFCEELSPEIVIEVESSVISTRLTEWSDCLRAALS